MIQSEMYTVVKDDQTGKYSIGYIMEGQFKICMGDLDERALLWIMDACSKWLDEAEQASPGRHSIDN